MSHAASWRAVAVGPALAGALLFTLKGAAATHVPVTALAFSPADGALVSSSDRGIDVRSPEDGRVQRHVGLGLAKVISLAFAPDGALLAVGGGEPDVRGEVRILDGSTKAERLAVGAFNDVVTSVAFDGHGSRLAVASADRTASVYSVDGGLERGGGPGLILVGHTGPVLAVAFDPAGEVLATASADRSIKIWSATDGRLLRTLSRHTEAIRAMTFQPPVVGGAEQVLCATAGDDRTVRVWQPRIGRMVRIVRGHRGPVLALAWSQDGRWLYSAGTEGIIRRIAGDSDFVDAEWATHQDWIYALAVSPDGRFLASSDWTGAVHVHRLEGR